VGTDTSFAAAVAVIVIVVTLSVFLLQRYLANRQKFSMTALRSIEPKHLPGWRGVAAHAYVYGFLTLALAPLVVVVVSSFRNTLYGQFVDGFSFDNYLDSQRDIMRYVGNTFSIGLTALAILVVVAVLVAYLTVRRRGVLSSTLDTMTMVPYVVPGLVIGIALVTAFSQKPLLLTGTFAIMVIALTIRRLPYSVRSTTALMYQLNPSIEEAAVSLGASKFRTLMRIIVPALAPGILSGAILSWVTIITELSTTLFLYNTSTQTLSLGIYAEVIRGQLGTAAALSTLLLVLTMLSLFVLMRLPGGQKELRVLLSAKTTGKRVACRRSASLVDGLQPDFAIVQEAGLTEQRQVQGIGQPYVAEVRIGFLGGIIRSINLRDEDDHEAPVAGKCLQGADLVGKGRMLAFLVQQLQVINNCQCAARRLLQLVDDINGADGVGAVEAKPGAELLGLETQLAQARQHVGIGIFQREEGALLA
jgi:iron(III) transport system permease protein